MTAEEKVYQADPAGCIKVARTHLWAANRMLLQGDVESAANEVRSALGWLPSWLEKRWDDQMCAWMERDGVPYADRLAGAEELFARMEALAQQWEMSADSAPVASCGEQLRDALAR